MAKKKHNYTELSQDWTPFPGKSSLSRIKRIMATTDTRHMSKVQKIQVPEKLPEAKLSKIYGRDDNGKFVLVGYSCLNCGKSMAKLEIALEHPLICNEQIKINKQEEKLQMPIQRIQKNGETYYRWGDHGKLYKDKTDAEKQARAAYASGYKEPPKQKKD